MSRRTPVASLKRGDRIRYRTMDSPTLRDATVHHLKPHGGGHVIVTTTGHRLTFDAGQYVERVGGQR